MNQPPETVFVVDDDRSIRDALACLLRSVGLRVELFASARDFLASPRHDAPSCLVLDVRMPVLSGLDCQHLLSESGYHIPIIFMTGHADVAVSVRAMKAGAADFLTKPFRDQDLLEAVQHAIGRDRHRFQEERAATALQQRFESLTPREQEVMTWVFAGRLNKQIADELGISEVTVKVHRGQVMRKMNADSVAELVRMAGRLGLSVRA